MNKILKTLFWLVLFGIGEITMVNGTLGVLPDGCLTELGIHNKIAVATEILTFNWFMVISGLITSIVGIVKATETK